MLSLILKIILFQFVVAALISACFAAKLDNTYLPPAGAGTSGGGPGLATPFGGGAPGSQGGFGGGAPGGQGGFGGGTPGGQGGFGGGAPGGQGGFGKNFSTYRN